MSTPAIAPTNAPDQTAFANQISEAFIAKLNEFAAGTVETNGEKANSRNITGS